VVCNGADEIARPARRRRSGDEMFVAYRSSRRAQTVADGVYALGRGALIRARSARCRTC
jgi:hypothetical protein